MAKIGIIGAGMAALSCARRLSSEHAITLFENRAALVVGFVPDAAI